MRTINYTEKGQVIELTTNELTEVLKPLSRGTFGWFEIETIVGMNKRNNPYFGQITKLTSGNILLGNSYETRVGNETNNPDFVPEKCNVGEHISKCVLFNENKGKHYLQYEWFNEVRPTSEYFYNGDRVEKELFVSFMKKYTPNKYGINFQSVTIDNIKKIHINGNQYIVVNPMTEVNVEEVEEVEV